MAGALNYKGVPAVGHEGIYIKKSLPDRHMEATLLLLIFDVAAALLAHITQHL